MRNFVSISKQNDTGFVYLSINNRLQTARKQTILTRVSLIPGFLTSVRLLCLKITFVTNYGVHGHIRRAIRGWKNVTFHNNCQCFVNNQVFCVIFASAVYAVNVELQ